LDHLKKVPKYAKKLRYLSFLGNVEVQEQVARRFHNSVETVAG